MMTSSSVEANGLIFLRDCNLATFLYQMIVNTRSSVSICFKDGK